MNEVIENMITRRSVRSYSDRVPENALVDEVIEAGLYAASGMDRQDSIIIKIQNKAMRDKISKMNAAIMHRDSDPFYGAPVILIVLFSKANPNGIYDGSLVLGNMMNAAHSLGLASCWIHRAKEEFESAEGKEILKKLGIEGEYEGVGHLALGYLEGKEPMCHERKNNRVFTI